MDVTGMNLFIVLFFILAVVVGILGIGLLIRLGRTGELEEATPLGCLLSAAGTSAIALVLMFFPFLNVVPALLFLVAGLRLLFQGGRLRIDGGLVLLLASAAWGVFLALQAELMEWEKGVAGAPIRV